MIKKLLDIFSKTNTNETKTSANETKTNTNETKTSANETKTNTNETKTSTAKKKIILRKWDLEKNEEWERTIGERITRGIRQEEFKVKQRRDEEEKKHKELIDSIIPPYLNEKNRLVTSSKFNEKLAAILNNIGIATDLHSIIYSYCLFSTEFKAGDDWSCLLGLEDFIDDKDNDDNYGKCGCKVNVNTLCPDHILLHFSLDQVSTLDGFYNSRLLLNGKPTMLRFEFIFDKPIVFKEFGYVGVFQSISKKEMEHTRILYRFWRSLKPTFRTNHFALQFYMLEKSKSYLNSDDMVKNKIELSEVDKFVHDDSWWKNKLFVVDYNAHMSSLAYSKKVSTLSKLSFDPSREIYGWDCINIYAEGLMHRDPF